MRKALVTGSNGFLGRHLADHLIASGWHVCMAVRVRKPNDPGDVIEVGAGQVGDFDAALTTVAPDVVFHLAGETRPAPAVDYYLANTLLAVRLFDAIKAQSRRPLVVLAGSAAEYGLVSSDALPVDENHPCRPFTDYGISKLAQTLIGLARSKNSPVLVARIFNLVGKNMPSHLSLPSFARQLKQMRDDDPLMVGNLDVGRDFIDVREAARLIVGLVDDTRTYNQVFNICSGRAFWLKDLVDRLLEFSGRKVRIEIDPGRLRTGEMSILCGSTARMERFGLKSEPPDFDVVLRELLSAGGVQETGLRTPVGKSGRL